MTALTAAQIELLRRAGEGIPLWGGSLATHRLQREVELLLRMRLLEPVAFRSYCLTVMGARALAAIEAHAMSSAAQ
jgi:hypothetical protein